MLIAEARRHFTIAKTQFIVAGQIADSSELLRRLETLPHAHKIFIGEPVSFIKYAKGPWKMAFYTRILKHAHKQLGFVIISLIMHP